MKIKITCETLNHPARISLILTIALAGAGLLYCGGLSREPFGKFHDDSLYVTRMWYLFTAAKRSTPADAHWDLPARKAVPSA